MYEIPTDFAWSTSSDENKSLEEKRLEKLELIRVQVASGALVIRPMTDEERRRYPPRHEHPKRPGSAGRGH